MERRREHIVDLLGGTLAMRDAGERWLPREPRESVIGYEARLARSVLYGATSDTISRLSAKPFSRPIRIVGNMPDILAPIEKNADRAGCSLHNVAMKSFVDASSYGLSGFFVDFPDVEVSSLGDIQRRGVYPAITPICARDVIYWIGSRDSSGMIRLGELRMRESSEDSGEEINSYRVRVVRSAEYGGTPTATWELWDRAADGKWTRTSFGTISHREIPFVPWYTHEAGVLRAIPPFEDLAWLNVRHWQSSSDQANILRYARIAQPWVTGVSEDEVSKFGIASVSQFLSSTAKEARFGMLEHSGASIEAGRRDLEDLESRMETLGLQPFIERVGDSTATGVVANQSGTMTLIQKWIRDEEDALTRALVIAHELMGGINAPIDPDLRVEIYSEFAVMAQAKGNFDAIDKMRARGDIDQRTLLEESQRYSIMAESRDVDAIIEATKAEGPNLSAIPGEPNAFRKPPKAKAEDGEPIEDDEPPVDDAAET
jgi:hypothetical protein